MNFKELILIFHSGLAARNLASGIVHFKRSFCNPNQAAGKIVSSRDQTHIKSTENMYLPPIGHTNNLSVEFLCVWSPVRQLAADNYA